MQELEKILEEIKGLIEKHKNKAYELVEREPLTQCYTEADIEQIKVHELAVVRDITRKHMNDGWIPIEERSPAGYERIGYDKQGNKYMQRLEIAYMTDTIEYVHGYYDGYKWMDKRHDIIENVVAWKIHKPYRPEREEK